MSASSQSSPTTGADISDYVDFSEYDKLGFQSPTASPSTTNKPQLLRGTSSINQALSGPSHEYDQYKQQTPFVPGALASTIALNTDSQMTGYSLDYMNTPSDDLFDFNSVPSQSVGGQEMEYGFSSGERQFYLGESTVNPNMIGGDESQAPAQSSHLGRMYPGIHQQAALAKAQAQQRQQQVIIQQQQQAVQQRQQAKQVRANRAASSNDPMVEQKITQLLNTMRAKANEPSLDGGANSPHLQVPRTKKEEDDMDEDERLLASEEGKKLSSKERRQLRNKVSARAFRSRRKEYITQLESEIANKVAENGDLRSANRALIEENRRLSDLTRMLLSSPSFSGFLDHLSSNPSTQAEQQQPQPEQRQPAPRQAPKDVNPFGPMGQQNAQHHQQIGMVMMPEQTLDFAMLSVNPDGFNYQPRVYTMQAPEVVIDAEILSGKTSNFVPESFPSETEKVTTPVVELPELRETVEPVEAATEATEPEKAVASLDGDIYDDETTVTSSKPVELNTDNLTSVDIFGGIETEKAFSRLELSESEQSAEDAACTLASRRIERLAARLEPIMARLDRLTIGL
ncbi:hypothetical protein F4821DRAFT_114685 [Hypoxylon rubiginosum]|uniref:Uncharacterized protein n=1 Tax=Hypoxylon rubiginosum TaxID=110542 RepID=A0ACC0DKA7_9PEZI|nr:hypothetical protein F4821DRAFT_114685 [Hypoxylon rubiginosum]